MPFRPLLLLPALALFAPAFAQAPAAPLTPTLDADPALVQRYQATITPDELAAHLYVFASDYFEGRETSAPGQKLAALYLAGQYAGMGVPPKGTAPHAFEGDLQPYMQPFELEREALVRAELDVTRGGEPVATTTFGPEASDGESFLAYGNPVAVTGGVVFGGYGIRHERYDDYAAMQAAGIEPGGRWLLVLADEPMDASGRSLITDDGAPSEFSQNFFRKIVTAFQTGRPQGMLIVGDRSPRETTLLAERAEGVLGSVGNLSLPGQGAGSARQIPPIFVISSAVADAILAPSGRTIAEVQAEIDAARAPVVFAVPETEVAGTVEKTTERVTTENVIAYVEGSDPELKDEFVVLTSHYDHIGIDPSRAGDQINNGADDDGSGTVALLEIAEAFQQARQDGHGPRRSLLFLHVSAEEKGLLGSEYYADVEPVVPLANTVTNLNIDMIGRHDPTHPTPEGMASDSNYVYIIGSNLISQELHDINQRANTLTATGLDQNERFNSADDPNQFYRRSDHWNFGKHGVPFIFYFTGTHEDYHQPGDEAHKIDYERMARIARLVFATTWQVANQDARPAVSGTGFN